MMSRWTLGRLLPLLMLVVVAMEFTLRLVPKGVFANRPFEAIGRRLSWDGPFKPNSEFHNPRSFGDLAELGNLPKRRSYHRVDFTTDALGFHNPASTTDVRWGGILFGDSFTIGGEVPEDKTLPAQLSPLFFGPLYNAGGYLPLDVGRVRQLAERLNVSKGIVLYEFLELRLSEAPPNKPEETTWRRELVLRALGPRNLNRLEQTLSAIFDSRLRLLARKFETLIENDHILPNGFVSKVVEGWFPNGDWMLFLRSRIAPVPSHDFAVNRWVDFICRASRQLRRDGLELVVIIVPDKFTVYGPLLASPSISTTGEVLLSQLEGLLRNNHIPVVNVTPAFRAAAVQLAQNHEYIYWQDDTHWNACGVTIAAAEFRAQLSRLPKLPGLRSRDSTRSQSNCGSQQISQNSTDYP